MQYRKLIQQVQDYSGFSDQESETALRAFITTMAARLQGGERKDFASQLPRELKVAALDTVADVKGGRDDFFASFMQTEALTDEPRAKTQILAVWSALKDCIIPGQITHIRQQLPKSLAAELH